MKVNVYRRDKVERYKARARKLFAEGKSLREIATLFKDEGFIRSHEWVRSILSEQSTAL